MIAVPVFAASFNYEEEASVLNQLDLFKGKSATEYVPALEDRLLREEAVALLLRMFSLEEEALAMGDKEADDLLAKFKDADQIAAWARKYVAYAVKNEIVVGRPDGNFAPQDNLLGREYSKMLLAMLGYVQGVDFEYEFSTSEFADVAGFPKSEAVKLDEAFLIRDDVVGMSFFALQAEYFAGDNAGKTVIEVIVGDDEDMKAIAIAAGLMEEAVVVEVAALDDIVIKVGEELKLPATVKATLSDGKEADVAVTWEDVDASEPMEKTEITGTIEGTDVVAKVNVTIEADALLVNSVTADNLVEVNVEYNQDVSDIEAVASKDNYSLNVGKIDSISVDGNTAVLSLVRADHPKNQTPAKLTVNDKILEEKETFEFTYFDRTLPKVLDIEITGPKSLNILFDEPIETYGKVTLKSGSSTLSVNTALKGGGTATITVPLYSSFSDGKTYEITIKEFVDYAGYNNEIRTIEFVYEKDETPPVATVDEVTQEYVKVSFNKPVKGLTPEHFYHSFSAWTALALSKKDAYPLDDEGKANDNFIGDKASVKTVYAFFYGKVSDEEGSLDKGKVERPIPEGETSFTIRTKNSDGVEIKDEWGNKFAGETYTIEVVADKIPPEVTEIKVTKEDEFKVIFSKNVKFDKDNIEVLDANGDKIKDLKWSPSGSGTKEMVVKLTKTFAGKSLLVNIKDVEDTTINTNKMAPYSEVIEITDKTEPEINKVAYEDDKDGKGFLYVFYDEAVDSDTALKVSNYYLYDGKYTKLTGSTSFFEGEKIVKIALNKDEYKIAKDIVDADNGGLFVTGVTDIAGNEILPEVNKIAGTLDEKNIPALEADTVKATAVDKIEARFDQELASVESSAFEVRGLKTKEEPLTYNTFEIVGMDVTLDSGKTKVILTLDPDKELPYDLKDGDTDVKLAIKDGSKIENFFGTNAAADSVSLIDKIAPAFDKFEDQVVGGKIVATFKEAVKSSVNPDLAATDFVITNKDDDKILVAGKDYTVDVNGTKEITIELKKDFSDKELNIATSEDRKYITDENDNKLAEFSKDLKIKVAIVPLTLSITGIDEEGYAKGQLLQASGDQETINSAVEAGIEGIVPIKVTLKRSEIGDVYKARISAPEVENFQFWAKDTEGNWYDINEVGWGSLEGFELGEVYDETTDVYVLTDAEPNDYTIDIKLVDVDNANEVLATVKATIKVIAADAGGEG